MSDCIFCKIRDGEIPSTVVHRADGFFAIQDIAPKADVHVLVIPERHIEDFRTCHLLSRGRSDRHCAPQTLRCQGWDDGVGRRGAWRFRLKDYRR